MDRRHRPAGVMPMADRRRRLARAGPTPDVPQTCSGLGAVTGTKGRGAEAAAALNSGVTFIRMAAAMAASSISVVVDVAAVDARGQHQQQE